MSEMGDTSFGPKHSKLPKLTLTVIFTSFGYENYL